MKSCLPALILSLAFVSPALAQDTTEELPVDPYEITNENAGADPVKGDALFKAFNEQAGIDRIVDGLVDRVIVDPRIEGIFRATDHVRLRRTLKEQFCYLLNGPCDYTGRDMASSHKDHGITTREFNALVEALQEAMEDEGVPYRAQNKLIAKLAPMKRDIVTR